MSLRTGTIKNFNKAPYHDQVKMILIGWGMGSSLSDSEVIKADRVKRFLPSEDCAREICKARGWNVR